MRAGALEARRKVAARYALPGRNRATRLQSKGSVPSDQTHSHHRATSDTQQRMAMDGWLAPLSRTT